MEGLYILSGSGKPRDPPGGAGDVAGERVMCGLLCLASDGLMEWNKCWDRTFLQTTDMSRLCI